MPTPLQLAHTHGPDAVDFVLIESIVPGGRALAKLRYYDAVADEMVTSEDRCRVWDNVYGTIEGDAGDTGWGFVILRIFASEGIPLVSVNGLSCPE